MSRRDGRACARRGTVRKNCAAPRAARKQARKLGGCVCVDKRRGGRGGGAGGGGRADGRAMKHDRGRRRVGGRRGAARPGRADSLECVLAPTSLLWRARCPARSAAGLETTGPPRAHRLRAHPRPSVLHDGGESQNPGAREQGTARGLRRALKAMGKVSSAFAQCVETTGTCCAGGRRGGRGRRGGQGREEEAAEARAQPGRAEARAHGVPALHARGAREDEGDGREDGADADHDGDRLAVEAAPESDKAGWKAKAAAAKADAACWRQFDQPPHPTPPRRPARPRCTPRAAATREEEEKEEARQASTASACRRSTSRSRTPTGAARRRTTQLGHTIYLVGLWPRVSVSGAA